MTGERDGLDREHAAFADWDGAYVLGALAPDERRAYEDHLAGCALCRAAVAELAPLPGLLARARPVADDWPETVPGAAGGPEHDDRTQAVPGAAGGPEHDDRAVDGEPGRGGGPPADLADLVVRHERRHRMRRRLLAGLAAVLVLGLAVAAPLVVQRLTAHVTVPARTVALTRQVDTPLTATVAFTPVTWGTRLSMECDYPAASAPPVYGQAGTAGAVYSLVVTDVDGTSSQVSTWSAQPGLDVHLDAATAIPLDRIASVAIRSGSGTTVLAAPLVTG